MSRQGTAEAEPVRAKASPRKRTATPLDEHRVVVASVDPEPIVPTPVAEHPATTAAPVEYGAEIGRPPAAFFENVADVGVARPTALIEQLVVEVSNDRVHEVCWRHGQPVRRTKGGVTPAGGPVAQMAGASIYVDCLRCKSDTVKHRQDHAFVEGQRGRHADAIVVTTTALGFAGEPQRPLTGVRPREPAHIAARSSPSAAGDRLESGSDYLPPRERSRWHERHIRIRREQFGDGPRVASLASRVQGAGRRRGS
jgi:hypothetical protein